jgi:hypothetical protein
MKRFVSPKHLARLLQVSEHTLKADKTRCPSAVLLVAGNKLRPIYELESRDMAMANQAVREVESTTELL